jgi:hypothetical protein
MHIAPAQQAGTVEASPKSGSRVASRPASPATSLRKISKVEEFLVIPGDPDALVRIDDDLAPTMHRVTLIDPGDTSHFGDPTPPAAQCRLSDGPSRAAAKAGAHCTCAARMSRPDADGVAEPVDRSPGPPGR